MTRFETSRSNEQGNILFYILLCVVMLAGLTFVLTQGSGESASGMRAGQVSDEIKTQAQTIRSALLECNLIHNMGYPPQPVSGLVKDVECQLEDGVTTQPIFSGTANRFMPPTPKPFTTGWQYTVDTSSDPDTITIGLSDAMDCTADRGLQGAMTILNTQYTADEADTVCNGATASFTLFIVDGTP